MIPEAPIFLPLATPLPSTSDRRSQFIIWSPHSYTSCLSTSPCNSMRLSSDLHALFSQRKSSTFRSTRAHRAEKERNRRINKTTRTQTISDAREAPRRGKNAEKTEKDKTPKHKKRKPITLGIVVDLDRARRAVVVHPWRGHGPEGRRQEAHDGGLSGEELLVVHVSILLARFMGYTVLYSSIAMGSGTSGCSGCSTAEYGYTLVAINCSGYTLIQMAINCIQLLKTAIIHSCRLIYHAVMYCSGCLQRCPCCACCRYMVFAEFSYNMATMQLIYRHVMYCSIFFAVRMLCMMATGLGGKGSGMWVLSGACCCMLLRCLGAGARHERAVGVGTDARRAPDFQPLGVMKGCNGWLTYSCITWEGLDGHMLVHSFPLSVLLHIWDTVLCRCSLVVCSIPLRAS